MLSAGQTGEAGALLFRFLYPDMRVPGLARVVGAVLGHLMFAEAQPYSRHDVPMEARADHALDAREINERRLPGDVLDVVAPHPRTRSAERTRGPVPKPVVGRAGPLES